MIYEIIDGVLVDVIAATGQQIGRSALAVLGRKRAEDLAIARWFDTYRLTSTRAPLRQIDPPIAELLGQRLQSDETHAVLHELMAARLTSAPETDIQRIRAVFHLTLSAENDELAAPADELFSYYDGQLIKMTARLQASRPAVLNQIRSEALASRMVAILQAIERHAAALSSRPALHDRRDFRERYMRHVREHHGQLEPPDFDRRRRVPVERLYVSPHIMAMSDSERQNHPDENVASDFDVWQLASQVDRAVLLGDPGGGKTTASNVLMNFYAEHNYEKIPFLVTLREFASTVPLERSIASYIEHRLETFYQCPPPAGFISYSLIIGTAVVIFDGLDELLDTSRRLEISSVIERFCAEYPLARVLVTSRLVGYDEARLDDRQFAAYRIGGFDEGQISEYVRKWFALEAQADLTVSDLSANSFISESATVPDLCSNPLMLALMCILYRGHGSLPRSRAEIYEQCASLLFRRWDARRGMRLQLRAAHLLEPALRHLAWLLFTRQEARQSMTERDLVQETASFLHGRGYESELDARGAASEFVEFCRGRLWVFSDTGTTSTGEKLYSFTHRTFLEYFSAAYLAYSSDTPERLVVTLAQRAARSEWEVTCELALQIKDRSSDLGANRIYETMLRDRRYHATKSRSGILQFLARSLRSVDPSPSVVRELAKTVLDHLVAGSLNDALRYRPLSWLIASGSSYYQLIDQEVGLQIATLLESDDADRRREALRLAVWLRYAPWGVSRGTLIDDDFWEARTRERVEANAPAILEAAVDDMEMRYAAITWNLISTEHALDLPGGMLPLVQVQPTGIFGINWASHLVSTLVEFLQGPQSIYGAKDVNGVYDKLRAVGRFVSRNPSLPWVDGECQPWCDYFGWDRATDQRWPQEPDSMAYLGAVCLLLMSSERVADRSLPERGVSSFGHLSEAASYVLKRWDQWDGPLPDLPAPPVFCDLFHEWANNAISFSTS